MSYTGSDGSPEKFEGSHVRPESVLNLTSEDAAHAIPSLKHIAPKSGDADTRPINCHCPRASALTSVSRSVRNTDVNKNDRRKIILPQNELSQNDHTRPTGPTRRFEPDQIDPFRAGHGQRNWLR